MDGNIDKIEEQKKELPSSLQKICLVCGDKALGYNFNAISCESCKAFFRRNAKVNKPVKCPFNNNCVITVVTRRFCQKCRLEKCLSIGMVKEFILSEEDKAMKRKKIEENRAKKRQLNEPDDGISSSKCMKRDDEASTYIPQGQNLLQYDAMNSSCSPSSTVQSPMHSDLEASMHSPSYYAPVQPTEQPYIMKVHPIDEKNRSKRPFDMEVPESYNMYENADTNSYTDPPKQSIRSLLTNGDKAPAREEEPHACDQPPPPTNDPDMNKAMEILQDVERIEPNTMELILCEAIKLEFAAFSSVSAYSNPSRELNEVERAKLNELIVANKMLHAPIEADLTQLIVDTPALKECDGKHDPRLLHIVNITAVAIRRFIKMAKKINAFKNMCEADQVALLKGGCIEMMVLRSTMTYDTQRKSWTIPHGEEEYCSIETGVLKLAKGNIYRTHEAFIRTFEPHWRADENVILVMSAILLFTPTRAMVVHKDVIKLEQYSYYYLLRRYLESIYPGCEAKSTFLKLIEKIIELRKLSEEITGVYLDVNPIEPLLMEIFDLKHHAA